MAKAKKKKELSLEEKIEHALVPVDEQPYEVPDNWCWVKVGTVCRFENGYAFKSDKFSEKGTMPVVRISNIKQNEIDIDSCVYTTEIGVDDKYIAQNGDLLIAMSGATTGKNGVFLSNVPAYVNQRVGNIKVKDEHILLPAYRNYYIMAMEEEILRGAYGGAQPNISSNKICSMNMPLPPVEEQKRIVAQIERLFAKLDEAKEKLLDMEDSFNLRKDAVLYDAFSGKLSRIWRKNNSVLKDTWCMVLLKDMIVSGPQNGMYKEKSAYGSGTPILRIDSFYDGYIVSWDKLKRLTLTNEELNLYHLNINDIVINRVNSMQYLGKSALVRELPEECVYESNMMRIKIDEANVYPEYLIKYLNSMLGLQKLRKNAKQAVNQASINQQDVKNVKVPLPSIAEQIEIVRLLELFRNEEEQAKEKIKAVIEEINLMKKSILAKAFCGELCTNNPDEESAVELLKSILATE